MGIDQLVQQKLHTLPLEKQYEVLDFMEFLVSRLKTPQTAEFPAKQRRRPPSGLKGKIKIRGDIIKPVVAEDEWDALQ